MIREAEFREFVAKYELVDARLDGSKIYVSPADYRKMANRVAASFVRPPAEPPGFLANFAGFEIYLDNDTAGLTVAEPAWLTEALKVLKGHPLQEHAELAWRHTAEIVLRNANGLVVQFYNVHTDQFDFVFGATKWPRLYDPQTGERFKDDPFRERRDDIPLPEFMTYLHDWYYPQATAMHWQNPEKSEV